MDCSEQIEMVKTERRNKSKITGFEAMEGAKEIEEEWWWCWFGGGTENREKQEGVRGREAERERGTR